MTDGSTHGQDDKTTAIVLPPQTSPHAAPQAPDAHADGRPAVLLLGSGELSRELAGALGHLGARVIAVEEHLTDADALSRAIRHHNPRFVVTATDAVAVGALEALSVTPEHERTELVPSARTVRLTADREALRRLAADELGLPTAPFWFVGSVGELRSVAAHAGYPLLVKPVSGRGHSVVSGPDDIEPAWQRAVGGAAGRVMAETVVDVDFNVTLLAVRREGPNGPVLEFCSPIGHRDADGAVLESWQPQQMSDAAVDAAKSIAARIIKALGGRGVFGVELMIKGDEVYFADVTAHPHPSVWVTLRSQRLSAFELQARAVLGLPVDTMMMSPAAAHLVAADPDGRSPAVAALNGALRVPESDLRIFGPRSTRLGVALATAPDVAAARDRARQVANALTVRDSRG
ncbi:phosphoribosylglycinamide formyltransferase 2 [Mycobacterium sp. E2699]|uniref:formate-dependent phosphoribosylglycinamide formyltransferase n=1 Tax=Mycobacterium sp. E2699 TaxID=1834137 RepID=UPI0007FFEC82|nr:formate-dependent phosphoribosylglycinamide formyltransferase [Mycobacterium sp. E2699]OBH00738.1 phosphoribosylglycinamide formyltransferase 2 [Mycobacterium sp. E2699]